MIDCLATGCNWRATKAQRACANIWICVRASGSREMFEGRDKWQTSKQKESQEHNEIESETHHTHTHSQTHQKVVQTLCEQKESGRRRRGGDGDGELERV